MDDAAVRLELHIAAAHSGYRKKHLKTLVRRGRVL